MAVPSAFISTDPRRFPEADCWLALIGAKSTRRALPGRVAISERAPTLGRPGSTGQLSNFRAPEARESEDHFACERSNADDIVREFHYLWLFQRLLKAIQPMKSA